MIILLIAIIFVLLVMYFIVKKYRRKLEATKNKKVINDGFIRKKPLTKTELKIYHEIRRELDERYLLLSQVRLADIIMVDTKKYRYKSAQWYARFNKISQKHCDYIVIDGVDGDVVCGIELDDHTHRQDNRINRDIQINALFKSIHIPLLRINANNVSEIKTLKIFIHK
ncbi:hypothetical protein A3Q29_21245 [Providencia stuartii]|uniref:DUF2726 domain-containing protein n=1 Tax=Providencia stuartii TaxID=588 RepID=A0A1S1HLC6_PROST|nr:hypothetical protein A3Q29_21245 [Providencia stuartii]